MSFSEAKKLATPKKPTEAFAEIAKKHFLHTHYFQAPGVAEAELGGQPREFLRRIYWALSAKGSLLDWSKHSSEGTGYLDVLAEPSESFPWSWLSEEDFEYYVTEYMREQGDAMFVGGLNSYRNADRNWEIAQAHRDKRIDVPALFISGVRDPVMKIASADSLERMRKLVPNLRGIHLIPNAGHFVMQEQPDAVNYALLSFLRNL
ncbi:MAG: alpha/beta hydrolase [Polyangiales bacterium]